MKLVGICVVIVGMIAINVGAGADGNIGTRYFKYDTIFPHDPATGDSWASVLFISFSTAAFAYVGVDIAASTALEARPESKGSKGAKRFWQTISVRFVATWTSFIVWVIYFLAGIMLSFNVRWEDPNLPLASFLGSPVNRTDDKQIRSNSGFVISASLSKIPGLADMVAAIILITVIFSANTTLYVASRALFVLARKVHGNEWYLQCLAFFGKTNHYQVPVRAMLLSCCFLWVPFLYLSPQSSPDTTIASLFEVLSQMGSVSCIIVWTCECWAFVRFYNWYSPQLCRHLCYVDTKLVFTNTVTRSTAPPPWPDSAAFPRA
jgi:amino acid transporter